MNYKITTLVGISLLSTMFIGCSIKDHNGYGININDFNKVKKLDNQNKLESYLDITQNEDENRVLICSSGITTINGKTVVANTGIGSTLTNDNNKINFGYLVFVNNEYVDEIGNYQYLEIPKDKKEEKLNISVYVAEYIKGDILSILIEKNHTPEFLYNDSKNKFDSWKSIQNKGIIKKDGLYIIGTKVIDTDINYKNKSEYYVIDKKIDMSDNISESYALKPITQNMISGDIMYQGSEYLSCYKKIKEED